MWTNTDTSAKLNGRYEAALTEAVARNHEVDLELALQRLQQNNVDTFAVQFKWVQNLIPRGETEQAVPRLNAMTPLDGPGYSAVRIWLVKQSKKPDALIPLSDQERQQQLQKAVQEQSRNPEAHLLLGESYLRQRQTRLAEHHFATASELDPNNAPDMLALQKILGRRRQELLLQPASAMQILQDRLSADQGDHQARISIARIMAILGDNKQA
ncbi:MAG: hypothetical protein GY826_37440, partial [Fuerstiella sp.]|nr:hypothetical protein [Fuerstiella sp.]